MPAGITDSVEVFSGGLSNTPELMMASQIKVTFLL